MKIATFNIQNLFHRDKSLTAPSLGHNAQQWAEELDRLMRLHRKGPNDFDRIRELSFLLGFEKVDTSRYAVLRKRNGRLYFQERGFSNEMKASHLTNWNGWMALHTVPLDEIAITNKARVVTEADADILLVRQVEDRASLLEFNKKLVLEFDVLPYEQIIAIEGNNSQGLGMGILTRNGYVLDSIKTHVHDTDGEGDPLFNIDCPEYTVVTPSGEEIIIVDTQLSAGSSAKRKQQAESIAQIYQRLVSVGKESIIVSGTLNDVPFSDALAPLLRDTNLTDTSKCDTFHVDKDEGTDASYFSMGAYRMGVNIRQREYLLLSPKLFAKLLDAGIHRKGVWQDKRPNWPIYPSIKYKRHAASEHPLIWGKLSI